MIILSLSERDPEAVRRILRRPPPGADGVEVRLDLLRARRPSRWMPTLRPAGVAIIATCRRADDGGAYRGGEESRMGMLREAARAGADYVDVEWGSRAAGELERYAPAKVIVSRHVRRATPRLDALREMEGRLSAQPGVAACKIVTHAARPGDMLRIRDLLGGGSSRRIPLAAFCMGELGVASRILAPSWGSWATYVREDAGRGTAPGQITLAEAIEVYRLGEIDASTELVGITGYPVAHSLSPPIHNAAFAHDGLGIRYLPFPARRPGDLADLMRELPIRGLSVTAPHKVAVMRMLADVEPQARAIGAVNTLLRSPEGWLGLNTDAEGILRAISAIRDPAGLRAMILGAGGAARAAAFALARAGCIVTVASRRAGPGARLARAAGARSVPLAGLARQDYDVLVNATPAGADGKSMPVPLAAVRGLAVVDLVYRPGGTRLVRLARERKIPAVGGEEILLEQGAAQYLLFTGREAPRATMRAALARRLSRAASGTR